MWGGMILMYWNKTQCTNQQNYSIFLVIDYSIIANERLFKQSASKKRYQFPVRNTKWLKNGKLRRAILSAFYNISQRNFGILLILWCSFKLWEKFCLDLSRSKFCLLGNRSIEPRSEAKDTCTSHCVVKPLPPPPTQAGNHISPDDFSIAYHLPLSL